MSDGCQLLYGGRRCFSDKIHNKCAVHVGLLTRNTRCSLFECRRLTWGGIDQNQFLDRESQQKDNNSTCATDLSPSGWH
ncbi:Uncharacterised protein [Vibrio cholerae]|nr:Uncharacterised protein [Vibrio cholerae]